ncbi:amidase [Pochonia chlamydosporia 170]|uniref:Amidase n=1 Tax=Pochonia chlamydosporia 170 TaxID=1380566 RepID=A0A179FJ81_METCM|nr:amidase [Pochonia chlamydosporia 170]OAQ65358.1 amidase [Pochonia chlamydosporia 170]
MELKAVLTTVISGSQYLVHPQVLGKIQETIKPDVILPVTVLEPEQLYNHLEGTLRLFDFYDDVFTPEFGSILIEKPGGNSGVSVASVGNGKYVMHLRNDTVTTKRSVSDLPAGPYILHGPNVHQAWKIYNDTLDAFAFGVYPENVDEIDGFQLLQLPPDSGINYTAIPVPSKLYSTVPPERAPLKGYRFAIPDSMSLKGIPTTFSSHAWSGLHNDTADSTAAFAKRLIELGATIVGKTKSSQFGSGREWADVIAPKNPREDGHQDPAGGATGAASSLAGYDWLRAATGLDAIGQVFDPAAAQGLFALRTSSGLLPLDGTQTSSSKSDSIGIFGTDLSGLFHDAVAIVHKSLASPPISYPKRIVYATDLSDPNEPHKNEQGQFLAAVEAFLGVKSKSISLTKTWASKPPPEAKGQSLQNYIKDAPFLSFCYEFYHQYDTFRGDYHTKFGREPTTEPTVKYRWDLGQKVTKQEYDEYQARLRVFQKWFDNAIMPTNEKGDTIIVAPYPSNAPIYQAPKPSNINGITADVLASVLGTPQILTPFAQFQYESKRSGQTEYHPIYSTILGPKGSDTMLVKLVEATFQQAQWRTKVDTGRFTFPPSQNARKVDDKPVRGSPDSLQEAQVEIGEL